MARRDQAGERLQQMKLLDVDRAARAGGNHAQHAHRSARGGQRQIDALGARQRGGAPAGRLAVIEHPFGHGLVVRTEERSRPTCGHPAGQRQIGPAPVCSGSSTTARTSEAAMTCRAAIRAICSRLCVAANSRPIGVERRRAPLAPPGRFGLKLHPRRQAC